MTRRLYTLLFTKLIFKLLRDHGTMADYYNLLTVSRTASAADIKTKYRQLSLKYHPDSGGSTEKMIELNQAYQTLSNPLLRREYDQKIRSTQAAPSSSYAHAAASTPYTAPTKPVYQPRRPEQTVHTYRHEARRSSPPVKEKSAFWSWFGVMAILVFAFIGYQLFTFFDSSSSSNSTTATTATISTTPSTVQSTDSTADDTTTNSTDQTTPTYSAYRSDYRRRYDTSVNDATQIEDTNDPTDSTTTN